MTDPTTATRTDELLALIRSGRTPKHVTEDREFLLMMWRMTRALEARAIENPEMLTQAVALAQRLSELVNVAIATSAERHAIDPHRAASMRECARAMGISAASASERKIRGDKVIAKRLADAGAARIGKHRASEPEREAATIDRAAEHAAVSLADFRARRAA